MLFVESSAADTLKLGPLSLGIDITSSIKVVITSYATGSDIVSSIVKVELTCILSGRAS